MNLSATGTAYDLTGPPGAPVLVLVHGLGLTRGSWNEVVPVLARAHRMLTYDLAGHGQSADCRTGRACRACPASLPG